MTLRLLPSTQGPHNIVVDIPGARGIGAERVVPGPVPKSGSFYSHLCSKYGDQRRPLSPSGSNIECPLNSRPQTRCSCRRDHVTEGFRAWQIIVGSVRVVVSQRLRSRA